MCLGTYPYIYMLSVFWGFWFCGCGLFVGGLWMVLLLFFLFWFGGGCLVFGWWVFCGGCVLGGYKSYKVTFVGFFCVVKT